MIQGATSNMHVRSNRYQVQCQSLFWELARLNVSQGGLCLQKVSKPLTSNSCKSKARVVFCQSDATFEKSQRVNWDKSFCAVFFSPYQMWIRFYHQETFICSSVNRRIQIVWEQKTDLMFRQQENVACLQQMWGCRCCTLPEWCPALKVCFDIKIVVRLTVMILWCSAIKLYLVKLQSRIISC